MESPASWTRRTALASLRRIHGPGAPLDAGHADEEFSLDGFTALLDAAARRQGRPPPRLLARYPMLTGNYADVLGAPEPTWVAAALAPFNGRLFDGASRVDAIVRLRPGVATAFELKLGTTRLSRTRIDEEWLTPCRPSHLGRRWKGNMMAILDRNFEELVDGDLAVQLNDERLVLTREWFVVARRQTLAMWKTAPPGFTEHVRFLAFEDIVAAFGGKDAFNALVRRMLDIDFYDEWVAPATSTGDER